jgi:DNA-binding response OmpR family regulator
MSSMGASFLHLGAPARPGRSRGTVLVVDDHEMVREVVTGYLEREGYRVEQAGDGESALRAIAAQRPDLLVLDTMLPGVDGFTVLREVRRTSDLPVVLLTARSEESDRVVGLDLGADDYVVKPFSPRELVARVGSVLRRAAPSHPPDRLVFADLVIDCTSREVSVAGAVIPTTAREFDLLAFMASSPRQVFTRGQLLEHVWASSADYQDPSTVTVHVRRLRLKVERDPEQPRHITTVWGVGYRFEP